MTPDSGEEFSCASLAKCEIIFPGSFITGSDTAAVPLSQRLFKLVGATCKKKKKKIRENIFSEYKSSGDDTSRIDRDSTPPVFCSAAPSAD